MLYLIEHQELQKGVKLSEIMLLFRQYSTRIRQKLTRKGECFSMDILNMSSDIRVKNSYESLYYCSNSNDPETDEVLREQIQKAFVMYDVLLSDRPSRETLREVMLEAYTESKKVLDRLQLTELEIKAFTRDFDCFTKEHQDFYNVTFKMFESKYQGDSVDLAAEYERSVRDQKEIPFMVDQQEYENKLLVEVGSKMSYLGHVSQASVPIIRQNYEVVSHEIPDLILEKSKWQRASNDEELEFKEPEL